MGVFLVFSPSILFTDTYLVEVETRYFFPSLFLLFWLFYLTVQSVVLWLLYKSRV